MDETLILANTEAHAPMTNPFWNMLAQLLHPDQGVKFEPKLPAGTTSVIHHGPFHGRDEQDDVIHA